jgi:hypothetical protein
MTTYITITEGEHTAVYATDTAEQIAEAQAALAAHGIDSARVWTGDPDCPDSYETGDVLWASASVTQIAEKMAAQDLDAWRSEGFLPDLLRRFAEGEPVADCDWTDAAIRGCAERNLSAAELQSVRDAYSHEVRESLELEAGE